MPSRRRNTNAGTVALGLTRFDGQLDYAASAALWWWILRDSYSAGVR